MEPVTGSTKDEGHPEEAMRSELETDRCLEGPLETPSTSRVQDGDGQGPGNLAR